MHIVISGNIGSGKTTLTHLLAKHYGWEERTEPVINNPYLSDYYRDIARWAFNLEVYFLKERFHEALAISQSTGNVVQDRSIWEGVNVFVENNMRMGNLSWRDHQTIVSLFEQMQRQIDLPDLTVYLRADIAHLVSNIQKRGRDYEQGISIEYLQGLNTLYERYFAKSYPGRVLTIDVTGMDFENRSGDLKKITDQLDSLVGGLFPLHDNKEPEGQGQQALNKPVQPQPCGKEHIAVAGNIGSGKTTLTRMLAKAYGWTPYTETVESPYLVDYYKDMSRWSFNTQVHFLSKRLRDAAEMAQREGYVVQDRTIYEDAHIFAQNLHHMGLMDDRDFACYCELFTLMTLGLRQPDLLIYLRAETATLAGRIQSRGRDFEKHITLDYLQGLNRLYESWIEGYDGKLIIVDADHCHFEDDNRDFLSITSRIDSLLFGLF